MITAKDIDLHVENQSPTFRRRYQQIQKSGNIVSEYLISHDLKNLKSLLANENHSNSLSIEEWLCIYRKSESERNRFFDLILHPIYQSRLSMAMQTVFFMKPEEVYETLSENNLEYKLLKEAIFVAALHKFYS